MDTLCIRHSELPGASALFRDYLYDFTKVSDYYAKPPSVASVTETAGSLRFPGGRRAAIAAALEHNNAGAGRDVAESLKRLAEPDAVVVATGQQVGLFGGPAFSLYKALAAAKWCDRLRSEGINAVPVFWLATEDHDIEEVDHAWLAGWDEPPERFRAEYTHPGQTAVGGVPISSVNFGDVRELWRKYPYGAETADDLARCYADGVSFRGGFERLMRHLLAGRGIVFLDPMRPEIRELAAPLMKRAITEAVSLNGELLARSADLVGAGYHAQVHVTAETCPFFTFEGDRRTPVKLAGDAFRIGRATHSVSDLTARIEAKPSDFSPNALLRPVLQDYLLPTVAYIGGPAELAYLAQSAVLYDRLIERRPVFLHRASFTVLGSRAQKVMSRYRLSLQDCLRPAVDLRRNIAGQLVPGDLSAAIAASERGVQDALQPLQPVLARFDPTLERSLRATEKKIRSQLGKLHAKTARQMLRRDEQATSDAEYIQHWVYPRRTMQERVYSAATFLARWGKPFLEEVYGAIEPTCADHQILRMH